MSELPEELTRQIAAKGAVIRRVRELDLVNQTAQTGTFERGQELFLRWAEGTSQTLAKYISEEEAERFESGAGLYTFESLDQYVQEYSNYLEGLLSTLQTNPEQLLKAPRREPTATALEAKLAPSSNALTKFDRFQNWWKDNWVAVIVVIGFGVLVVVATGAKNIRDAVVSFTQSPEPISSPVIPKSIAAPEPTPSISAPPRRVADSAIPSEPVLDLAIGEPFGSSTLIVVKNSGIEPLVSVEVNLRCFFLRQPDDPAPALFYYGFLSMDNASSWWLIKSFAPREKAMKEAADFLNECLRNGELVPKYRDSKASRRAVLAVDVDFQRRADAKRFALSRVAEVFKDANTGKAFVTPLPMSDFYRRLLETVQAPNYRK